jgi:hypothetical protein
VEYLRLWSAVHVAAQQSPAPGAVDVFICKWSSDGAFSSRSAYDMLFQGTTGLAAAPLIWDSFAPLKHRFHAWLALRRRCWTADRRIRRGLPSHLLCPLCGLTLETLDHLSLHCPYAQEIWASLVTRICLPTVVPTHNSGINDCWLLAAARVPNT